MNLGMEVGLGPGDILLDRDPASLPLKRGHSSPLFSAHVHCGQTAGWIKMPLGMEIVALVAASVLTLGWAAERSSGL